MDITKLSFTDEYGVTKEGDVYSFKSGKPYKLKQPNSHGYGVVSLHINKQRQLWFVHRLVATTFLDNPNNYPTVNHKNGVKLDNRVDNLEWCTNEYNASHAHKTGLCNVVGESNPSNVYSEDDIRKVCELLQEGLTNQEISTKLGVCSSTISAIRCGVGWKHISKGYTISRKNNKHLSPEDVHEICKRISVGDKQKDIAFEYKIPANYVSDIKACRRYKQISKLYF